MTAPPFRLLAITPPTGPVPADSLDRWLAAGVAAPAIAVLLREPGRRAAEILRPDARLAALRRRCAAAGVPLLVSTDLAELPDLDLPPDLAGLHLRGDPDPSALPAARARLARPVPGDMSSRPTRNPGDPAPPNLTVRALELADPSSPARDRSDPAPAGDPVPLLGRSCHGAPQPGHGDVDYTLFAPVFAPTTAPAGKTPAGLTALRAWTRAPGARVFALGGVGPATAAACLAAGAWGLAGIGVFFGEPARVEQDVAALREFVAAHARHVEPVSPR